MGKALYIGDDSYKARKVKKIYVGGSDGKAHKVKKMYVGDANGIARLAWSSGISSFVRSTMSLNNSGNEWIDNGTKFLAFGGGSYTTYVYDYNPINGSYSTIVSKDLGQSFYPRYSMWLDDTRIIVMSVYYNSSNTNYNGVLFFIYDTATKSFSYSRSDYNISGTNTYSFCIVNNVVYTRVGTYQVTWDLNTYTFTKTNIGTQMQGDVLVNTPDRTKGYFIQFTSNSTNKVLKIWGMYGNVTTGVIKTIDLPTNYNWNILDPSLLIEAREYGEYWWYVPSAQIVLALDVNSLTTRIIPCSNTGTYLAIGKDFPCAYNRELKTIYMFQDSRNCVKLEAVE